MFILSVQLLFRLVCLSQNTFDNYYGPYIMNNNLTNGGLTGKLYCVPIGQYAEAQYLR